jgi:hypothetical protein
MTEPYSVQLRRLADLVAAHEPPAATTTPGPRPAAAVPIAEIDWSKWAALIAWLNSQAGNRGETK